MWKYLGGLAKSSQLIPDYHFKGMFLCKHSNFRCTISITNSEEKSKEFSIVAFLGLYHISRTFKADVPSILLSWVFLAVSIFFYDSHIRHYEVEFSFLPIKAAILYIFTYHKNIVSNIGKIFQIKFLSDKTAEMSKVFLCDHT